MFSEHTVLLINIACIFFLITMLTVLAAATRMKGGAGLAALISVVTTVPGYLVTFAFTLSPQWFIWFVYPAVTLNVICLPALWLFVRSQFEKSFHISWTVLFHLLAAVISLGVNIAYYSQLPIEQIVADKDNMRDGIDNMPTIFNNTLICIQTVLYFPYMIWYIRKKKKYLQDNFSDSDYLSVRWIDGFVGVAFGLMVIWAIIYMVVSVYDATWVIPVLNVIGVAYLVYCAIYHSTVAYVNRLPDTPAETPENIETTETTENSITSSSLSQPSKNRMSKQQMADICNRITQYLQTTAAYTNPDFTIYMLAQETGIHHRKISAVLNGFMNRNFFDFVNAMRVEEAKRRLLQLSAEDYTIDSISIACGFQSRTSFFRTFRKFEGLTPSQWLKSNS